MTRPTAAFPDRPQHPDFAWLSEHVIALDARSDEPGFSVADHLAALPIDPDSLAYLARQRGKMALDQLLATNIIRGLLVSQRLALITMAGGAYMDAFALGTQYGRKLAAEGR